MRRAVQQPAQQPSLQRDPTGAQCGGHGEAAAFLADPRGTRPVAGPCSEIPAASPIWAIRASSLPFSSAWRRLTPSGLWRTPGEEAPWSGPCGTP
jgi:hypothetical protein